MASRFEHRVGGPLHGLVLLLVEGCGGQAGRPGLTEVQILAGHTSLSTSQVLIMTMPGKGISSEWIDGCVSIKADDITIKKSLVHTRHPCTGYSGSTSLSAISDGQGVREPDRTLVEDTTVDGIVPGMEAPATAEGIFLGAGKHMPALQRVRLR